MIAFLRRAFAFPLLAKDLTERAAQRRTYVLRVAFGLLFALLFRALFTAQEHRIESGISGILGSGAMIFYLLKTLLVWAILLFQPVLMAGVLTHEKERETLPLLLLADMKPWRLLLQKFIGGLLPMFTLLLYALPLAAIAYSYGGVSGPDVFFAALTVGGAWMQVGALSLLCSAWFRTTTRATVAALVLSIIIIPGGDYLGDSIRKYGSRTSEPPVLISAPAILKGRVLGYDDSNDEETIYFRIGSYTVPNEALLALRFTAPLFLSAGIFLLLTRLVFIRRAFAPTGNGGRRVFAWLDLFFEKLNRKLGNASFFRSNHNTLPLEEPVRWRETNRGILGSPVHLIRLGFLLQVIVWLFIILVESHRFENRTGTGTLQFLKFIGNLNLSYNSLANLITVLGLICVAVTTCNAIGNERSGQTLDVLLTTPIPRRDIVCQKHGAARNLSWIFISSLYVIASVESFIGSYDGYSAWKHTHTTDVILLGGWHRWFSIVCTFIGIPLLFISVRWFAMWLSIVIKNRTHAFLSVIGVLAAWTAAPIALESFDLVKRYILRWIAATSPIGVLYHNKRHSFGELPGTRDSIGRYIPDIASYGGDFDSSTTCAVVFAGAAIAIAIQLAMIAFFRNAALRAADKKLRQ